MQIVLNGDHASSPIQNMSLILRSSRVCLNVFVYLCAFMYANDFQLAGIWGPGLRWQDVCVRSGELSRPESNGLFPRERLHPVATDCWLCEFFSIFWCF